MPADLPEYYFRIRDNGASVFRIVREGRQMRLDMQEIAMVNSRNGSIRPHGDHVLSEADEAAIHSWLEARRKTLASRDEGQIAALVEQINLVTQYLQSRASPAEIDALGDDLLLAMHDLRSVLVRKKSEALAAGES